MKKVLTKLAGILLLLACVFSSVSCSVANLVGEEPKDNDEVEKGDGGADGETEKKKYIFAGDVELPTTVDNVIFRDEELYPKYGYVAPDYAYRRESELTFKDFGGKMVDEKLYEALSGAEDSDYIAISLFSNSEDLWSYEYEGRTFEEYVNIGKAIKADPESKFKEEFANPMEVAKILEDILFEYYVNRSQVAFDGIPVDKYCIDRFQSVIFMAIRKSDFEALNFEGIENYLFYLESYADSSPFIGTDEESVSRIAHVFIY